MQVTHFLSPIGMVQITEERECITQIRFADGEVIPLPYSSAVLDEYIAQLDAYCNSGLREFDLPLAPKGTDFQKLVWAELQNIPFGKTVSYLDMAKRLGDPNVIRAAGTANGKNPLAIVIPCHRVIGSDGSLTGYAGGLKRKQWLLEHESSQITLF